MSLDRRATFGMMLGRMGSGKSWCLVRYLVDEWLPDHTGRFICNLPLNIEAIATYCEKTHGLDPQRVRDRLTVIPHEVFDQWTEGVGSPGEFIDQLHKDELKAQDLTEEEADELEIAHPLARAIIVLDEAFQFLPAEPKTEQRNIIRKTAKWMRLCRHHGARVLFCTQTEMDVAASIRRIAAFQIHLTNLGDWREPLSGILCSDWFEAAALWTGQYITWVKEEQYIANGTSLESDYVRRWLMWPKYFKLYNSNNLADDKAGEEEPFAFERYSFFGFWRWFIKRNAWSFISRGAIVAAALILLWPGMVIVKVGQWAFNEANEIIEEARVSAMANKPKAETPGAVTMDSEQRLAGTAPRAEVTEPVIVFISPKAIMTADGATYHVGKIINGHRLMRIDSPNGEVVFADHPPIRLGQRLPIAGPPNSPGSELQGSLPSTH